MASKGHSLAEILEAFNSPLKFDQAWALIQVYLRQVRDDQLWPIFNGLSELFVHPDGAISSSHDLKRTSIETDFLEAFGRLIYNALDYGYGEDDEPDLPEDLERLITFMTGTVDSDPEDDGYSEKTMTIRAVLKHCRVRAGQGYSEHYTKVVRAFYFEALELMEFLSKISTANESLKSLNSDPSESEIQEIDALRRKQWSSAWGEVMLDLRHGVPLKHIQNNEGPAPARFEFTPYEMLLSDIRKKTYKLKHVEAQENETAKTTHDVILDFIRSRPPLVPASKRQLTPKPKMTNKHDSLMNEIRSGSVLKSVPMDLRPKPEESAIDSIKDIIRSESVGSKVKNAKKKVIRLSQIDLVQSESDDEDMLSLEFEQQIISSTSTSSHESPSKVVQPQICMEPSRAASEVVISPASFIKRTGLSSGLSRSNSVRSGVSGWQKPRPPTSTSCYSISTSISPAMRPGQDEVWNYTPFKRSSTLNGIVKGQRRSDHTVFGSSKRTAGGIRGEQHELWSHPMECLKLTVRELSHICQVFSRAEIEKYHSQTNLYKQLTKDQICLNCKIQKFSWVLWAHTCEICKSKVCKKCVRKVASPTDDILEAAAYTLYPVDTPENAWDSTKRLERCRKLNVCDSCVDMLSHIVDNARRALEARSKFN